LSVQRDGDVLQLPCQPLKIPQEKSWLQLKQGEQILEFYADDAKLCVLTSQGDLFAPFPLDAFLRSCNGIPTHSLQDLLAIVQSSQGKNLMFELVYRSHSQLISLPAMEFDVQLHDMQYAFRLGILFKQKMILTHPTPWRQFADSIRSTVETFSRLINKDSDIKMQHLMGAPGIMRLLHRFSTDDFRRLLWFIVLLNINLAILNLFPIPVLDGGYILFACITKIRGKALSAKFVNALQSLFVVLFLWLMLYVTIFDLRRWQGDLQMELAEKRLLKLAIPVRLDTGTP
jgi:regulator of sigma E protease